MPYQACQKSLFDTLVDGRASAPQFAMVVLLRLTACSTSLLIGLTSRCFVPQFAIVALLRYRLQVSFAHWTSASPVSRTARGEAPSHWARASCAPVVHAAGDDGSAKGLCPSLWFFDRLLWA